jgi:nicotinamide-nucleotide amidase
MNLIQATIITIGDELLIGQVIDTNSAFIAQSLSKIGIPVTSRIAVGDNKADIINALDTASQKSKIIILTGGLGPTADDITKPLLNEYFGGKMIIHQPSLDHITHIFETIHKRPMIDRNRKQAEVPDVCEVLFNEKGTAPGMLFKKEGVYYFSLPGVPHEMRWLTENQVIPVIQKAFSSHFIAHRTLLTAGIGESFLAEHIAHFENALPASIKLAYLPNIGMVRLRLTGSGQDEKALDKELNTQFEALKKAVNEYLVTDADETMEMVVGNLLKQKKQTVSTAESCTGGLIASKITEISGSSDIFKGSIVTYSNNIKEQELGVNKQTMIDNGVVSIEVVNEMLDGVLKKFENAEELIEEVKKTIEIADYKLNFKKKNNFPKFLESFQNS